MMSRRRSATRVRSHIVGLRATCVRLIFGMPFDIISSNAFFNGVRQVHGFSGNVGTEETKPKELEEKLSEKNDKTGNGKRSITTGRLANTHSTCSA